MDQIPILHAIECGLFDTFEGLLAVGADAYIVDNDGENILSRALIHRNTKIITYIVKIHPDLFFQPNKDDKLPIDRIGRGYSKTVKKVVMKVYDKEIERRNTL